MTRRYRSAQDGALNTQYSPESVWSAGYPSPEDLPGAKFVTGLQPTSLACLSMMDPYQHNRGGGEASISESSFKRRFRLTNATDFQRVFRESRRSADGVFTVLYRHNGLGYPRLGMAIAKKQVRSAVSRNRLKRLIRESFRGAKGQLTDLDIVIMARRKAESTVNAAIYASLSKHWQTLIAPDETKTNGQR